MEAARSASRWRTPSTGETRCTRTRTRRAGSLAVVALACQLMCWCAARWGPRSPTAGECIVALASVAAAASAAGRAHERPCGCSDASLAPGLTSIPPPPPTPQGGLCWPILSGCRPPSHRGKGEGPGGEPKRLQLPALSADRSPAGIDAAHAHRNRPCRHRRSRSVRQRLMQRSAGACWETASDVAWCWWRPCRADAARGTHACLLVDFVSGTLCTLLFACLLAIDADRQM